MRRRRSATRRRAPRKSARRKRTTRSRPQAAYEPVATAVRLLLIDDDAEYRKILRYHIEVEWPQAVVVDHQPGSTGRGPRDVPLAGFDAVLLGHPIGDEQGFAWLDGLAERGDCPPVLLFADPSDE